MNRTAVESSLLKSVGYDAESQTLEVELAPGRVYQYFDVPAEVYRDLMKAGSLGGYFNDEIRDVYAYAKVSAPRRRR
jgi:KTSC domain